ncbi:MAG: transcriptional repressor [Myxococcales bacterium]|nr:transcriptional repressor [Myxococcales bacterium]MCB9526216.1 transcriptional repressor [Myxococcales bacterium]
MRRTEQKQAIKAVLDDAGRPLSAQEVLDAATTEVPTLGLATVYRNLKALTESGWLHPVELPGQPVRYERAHLQHHHHFMCEACGRVFDVVGCSVHTAAHGVPKGFEVVRHEVNFYGRCAECAGQG